MAGADSTGDRASFETIDWEELGGVALSSRGKQMLAFAAVYLALGIWDAGVLHSGINTLILDPLGMTSEWIAAQRGVTLDFTIPGTGFEVNHDVLGVDWLFLLTLAVGYFYVGLPLYRDRRLSAYYWRQFRKNKAAVLSLLYLGFIFVVGVLGPLLFEPPTVAPIEQYQPPVFVAVDDAVPLQCMGETAGGACYGTWAHPLGTTSRGKDILKLVVLGMRISMQVGLITMLLIITIGSLVGTTAAYFGGYVDEVLMRYVDLQASFPSFFLFLIMGYLFQPSLFLLIVLFGLLGWEGTSRLVRSEALQRTEEAYVKAAENVGASDGYIIRRHLLPNVSNTLVTNATLLIPSLILTEAALSFLALTSTEASWGKVISDGRGDLDTAWWISTVPGFFLFFTILAFNFIGDGLNDALDPRRAQED
jgi:peptide/nickel transport system permease protein